MTNHLIFEFEMRMYYEYGYPVNHKLIMDTVDFNSATKKRTNNGGVKNRSTPTLPIIAKNICQEIFII